MDNDLQLNRIPATDHPSLKAWNAADELMADYSSTKEQSIGIYNDAFGYLSCRLAGANASIITDLKSQATAIQTNAERIKNKLCLFVPQFFDLVKSTMSMLMILRGLKS